MTTGAVLVIGGFVALVVGAIFDSKSLAAAGGVALAIGTVTIALGLFA